MSTIDDIKILKADNKRLKALLLKTANMLDEALDNIEGAYGSAGDVSFREWYEKSRKFMSDNFQ